MITKPIQPIDILRYYVTYMDIEKQILESIKSKDKEIRNSALKKYMNSHMGIGRNFRTNTVDMILVTVENLFWENSRDVEDLSRRFYVGELLNSNIKNAKVAASKLLWLFNQSIIIMDSVNLKILGVKSDNYNEYAKKWNEAYLLKAIEISKVIDTFNLSKIDPIIEEEWFKMRVFDQYLWTLGQK